MTPSGGHKPARASRSSGPILLSSFLPPFGFPLRPSAFRSALPFLALRLSVLSLDLRLPLLRLRRPLGLLLKLPLRRRLWSLRLRRPDLLLVLLDLGPLLVLLLPLLSQCLLLLSRSRLVTLNSPGLLLLPIPVIVPAFPALLKPAVVDPLIIPWVSVPVMASVVPSPARVDIIIEAWDMIEIGPAPIVITGAVPVPIPQAPPPAVVEEHIPVHIGNRIDVGRIGQHYHRRRCLKDDGRRQGYSDAHAYLRHGRKRNQDEYR